MANFRKFLRETVTTILLALVLAVIIRTYVVEARVIPSSSMLPTIEKWDRVLVNKIVYDISDPDRRDVIVFEAPVNTGEENQDFIKRVIALPGETVEIKNGRVFINGEPLEEDYVMENPEYNYGPVEVPSDSLFVLGDNRNSSYDSHLWEDAWLKVDKVKGEAFIRYWPPDRLGFLD